MASQDETEELRSEVARLRAENEELRDRFRIGPPDPPTDSDQDGEEKRPIKVLLLPDPMQEGNEGRLGPQAIANVAAVVLDTMRERRPDFEWRAEHDLERVPAGAECFQLGHVLRRIWDGTGRIPPTYRVVREQNSEPTIRRCLVKGEEESDQFLEGHHRLIQDFDDLAAEGEAAIVAGEGHHAGWVLKALDVVLAHIELARVCFETDGDWRKVLAEPRPEYLLPHGMRIDAVPEPQSS